jgi:predicted acylesterase/phospholipase RssA
MRPCEQRPSPCRSRTRLFHPAPTASSTASTSSSGTGPIPRRVIADLARHRSYNIIHLIYQSKIYEGHSRDYEFGLSAMRTHWQSGLDDIRRTLAEPRRLDRPAPELGMVTHDIHHRD